MNLIRKLLLPIVPIYYAVTWLRNLLYDKGIFKSTSYSFPLICVGNLSVGGTGKSPMIEYLINILKDRNKLATLSRGYKRTSKGFRLVEASDTVELVGDEPLQFKKKFNDVLVAVDADRRNGIKNLRALNVPPETILLDDAFQHRKVKANLSIVLTTFQELYYNDMVLPTGNLREPKSGADRASIIVVTKCPTTITEEEMNVVKNKLDLKSHQKLFYTSISYDTNVVNTNNSRSLDSLKDKRFTLVTGIANPKTLVSHYTSLGLQFDHINYPDHHNFSANEIANLNSLDTIVTTEKDYVRLQDHITDSKLWYQPMKVSFVTNQKEFDTRIISFVENYKNL